jgi:hypothetical protein
MRSGRFDPGFGFRPQYGRAAPVDHPRRHSIAKFFNCHFLGSQEPKVAYCAHIIAKRERSVALMGAYCC